MNQAELQTLLYQALAEPIGLVLRVEDFARARQRLYAARAACQDEALKGLQFRGWTGPEGNLVIVKQTIQVGGQGG